MVKRERLFVSGHLSCTSVPPLLWWSKNVSLLWPY